MKESKLADKLENNCFPVTVELFSVRGVMVDELIQTARKLSCVASAFNITDNHRATMRTCPLALCARLEAEGLESVYQVTCRDRNRLALQSDLLGAGVLGIKNVFAVTGDHLSSGDYPMAFPVFDLDSVQLLKIISTLEEGRDSAGKKLKGSPVFFKGAAVNLNAEPDWIHVSKLHKKITAGAQFFQTQLIFNAEKAVKTLSLVKKKAFFLAGVTILKNAAFTRFLKEKVPGISIPDSMLAYQEKSGDELRAGKEIAVSLIKELKPHFSGLHVMAFGLEEFIPEILKKAGLE